MLRLNFNLISFISSGEGDTKDDSWEKWDQFSLNFAVGHFTLLFRTERTATGGVFDIVAT